MIRRRTGRVATRLITGLDALNRDFGPLFTGSAVALLLLVVLAAVIGEAWLIAVAAVLAIAMSVWVLRAGIEDVAVNEVDASYDALAKERERTS